MGKNIALGTLLVLAMVILTITSVGGAIIAGVMIASWVAYMAFIVGWWVYVIKSAFTGGLFRQFGTKANDNVNPCSFWYHLHYRPSFACIAKKRGKVKVTNLKGYLNNYFVDNGSTKLVEME